MLNLSVTHLEGLIKLLPPLRKEKDGVNRMNLMDNLIEIMDYVN